ncbi:inactive serine/threonine-protein kinase TEX14-like isoform X3 [Trichomycterus rosablanca]|uniref:inactive serine/threonine-protein kinase TEX14-like isoform X3 n=1 Tax=Trichomycterus rosablanca TaxID=2290929 RepID=UPI002F360AC1
MPTSPPVPCPVRLGMVKTGGLPAQLHRNTRERNVHKVEKLLKKGVDVDCVNHLGQTALFCASLLGFTGVAELLLQYGANPNHRCDDRSTPVHAAVFSCNPRLLSELLDAGGDLRLHDDQGRTPRDWADIGAQEHSARMLEFLKSCASHMKILSQSHSPRAAPLSPGSSKTLLRSPSLLQLLRPGGSDHMINRNPRLKASACDTVQCFGFGKMCVEKKQLPVGVLASLPLIPESELLQADDEALHAFACGSFMQLINYSWRGSRVTVKELQHVRKHDYQDLLITELQHCCHLFHSHLLQLMAVSVSTDLLQTRLVYERVHVGSLYTLLYHKRAEFPVLQVCEMLLTLLQVCEALLYLHTRSLVLRSLSSHSVIIVHPGVAKVTNLGFITPSDGGQIRSASLLPIPLMLCNWAAPEVIRNNSCTGKADLYSMCALIQEVYTDAVPWGPVDPHWIKQAADAGQALCADPAVPQPYYDLLLTGLNPRAGDRTCSLQDLRYTLRSDLKELNQREGRRAGRPLEVRARTDRWSTEAQPEQPGVHCATVQYSVHPDSPPTDQPPLEREILQHLDSFLEKEREETESSASTTQLVRDILPLDEWRLSPRPPSEPPEGETETEEDEHPSVSEHISSIVLNLKVSRVLMQQAESGLELAEPRIMGNPRPDCPRFDEVDGFGWRTERKVEVLKAVGPPPVYRPGLGFQETEEEVSEFCSAGEGSFDSSEGDGGGSEEQLCGSRFYQSDVHHVEEEQQRAPTWTSEVRAAVARMARGLLGTATAVSVSSGESEEVQEQRRQLVDVQENTELEQLFRSFAGIGSDSEENTDFYTINHTKDLNHQQEDRSESDHTPSPLEPSSIFYTPAHDMEDLDRTEERSQTLSSEEDPDVTMEVCRPATPAETVFTDPPASEEQDQTDAVPEPEPGSTHSTRSGHVTDIAEISSIACSPAQYLEWAGLAGAPPSTRGTRLPPCNSTPRSPVGHGRSAPQREVCGTTPVPYPHSLAETSLWGSAASPSSTQTYNTARPESTVSTVNRSPEVRDSIQEDSDTPTTGNPEFTTASSGVRHTSDSSSQNHTTGISAVQSDAPPQRGDEDKSSSIAPQGLEESRRAHTTLDEELRDLLENLDTQRSSQRPESFSEHRLGLTREEEGEGNEKIMELLEESGCPAGDGSEGAAWSETHWTEPLTTGPSSTQTKVLGHPTVSVFQNRTDFGTEERTRLMIQD